MNEVMNQSTPNPLDHSLSPANHALFIHHRFDSSNLFLQINQACILVSRTDKMYL